MLQRILQKSNRYKLVTKYGTFQDLHRTLKEWDRANDLKSRIFVEDVCKWLLINVYKEKL